LTNIDAKQQVLETDEQLSLTAVDAGQQLWNTEEKNCRRRRAATDGNEGAAFIDDHRRRLAKGGGDGGWGQGKCPLIFEGGEHLNTKSPIIGGLE
jgi:hypothetical protein